MERVIQFGIRVCAMALVASLAERLIPDGAIKSCASASIGLAFAAEIAQEIVGIFERMGV